MSGHHPQLLAMAEVLREMADTVEGIARTTGVAAPGAAPVTDPLAPVKLHITLSCGGVGYEIPMFQLREVQKYTRAMQKINAIKLVRTICPTAGLKSAKDFVESDCGGLFTGLDAGF